MSYNHNPTQLTKSNLNEAKVEITVLRDELARVSAVASRVARAELRGGEPSPRDACRGYIAEPY